MPEEWIWDSIDQAEKDSCWTGIEGIIFDVDGTLYHQRPVRIQMAIRLAGYYGTHLFGIPELKGIYNFRKVREEEAFQAFSIERQIQEAARRSGIRDAAVLGQAIQRWMFREPLRQIAAHPNKEVLSFLRRQQAEGRRIIIYSDYAAEEKLAVLDISPDAVYYPGIAGIREMKPSLDSMNKILRREALRPDHAVMVGDRMEKDGKSAELVGMPFLLVR